MQPSRGRPGEARGARGVALARRAAPEFTSAASLRRKTEISMADFCWFLGPLREVVLRVALQASQALDDAALKSLAYAFVSFITRPHADDEIAVLVSRTISISKDAPSCCVRILLTADGPDARRAAGVAGVGSTSIPRDPKGKMLALDLAVTLPRFRAERQGSIRFAPACPSRCSRCQQKRHQIQQKRSLSCRRPRPKCSKPLHIDSLAHTADKLCSSSNPPTHPDNKGKARQLASTDHRAVLGAAPFCTGG